MTRDVIEISIREVTNMEARVVARYRAAEGDGVQEAGPIVLRGLMRGPFCEYAHTLPAEFAFRDLGTGSAEAVVTDPCLWSSELPHLYHVDVEARRGEHVVAEYHGKVGLRQTPYKQDVDSEQE
jgi:hypothetical protein